MTIALSTQQSPLPLSNGEELLHQQFAEVVSDRIILEFDLDAGAGITDGISRVDDTGHLQDEYLQFLRHNLHFICEMCQVTSETFSRQQINEAFQLVDDFAGTYEASKRFRKCFDEWMTEKDDFI